MVRLTDIRFEHHVSPVIGIGECEPRISWGFEGQENRLIQRSYELEVSVADGPARVFTVESSQSVLVPWPSRRLQSRERALVRVRASFQSSQLITAWSDYAIVETGILRADEWTASLIQPASVLKQRGPHRPVIFRYRTVLEQTVVSARMYITAQGIYEATFNGQQIGNHVLSPGWTSYSHRLTYQTFDILEHVQTGKENILDVTVAAGWFCGRLGFNGRQNIYGDSLGLTAMLIFQLENGETVVSSTDEHWRCAYGPHLAAELYDGVEYDFLQEVSTKTAWYPVEVKTLETMLVAPTGPPVRRTQILRPKGISTSSSGRTIVDFGQNFVGWVRLRAHGPAGTQIVLQHVEVLENGECSTRPLRAAKARDSVILPDWPVVWEPKMTFHGFRYVQIDGYPGDLRLDDISGVVVGTDMTRTGFFSCSNPLINQLHENVVWSMRGNFLSIPTDCPQRDERLGWTGDINVFADTANFLFDTAGMLVSWLEDLKLEQHDGIVPLVIPNVIEASSLDAHAVWGDVAIMLPWSLYKATGDLDILARQYGSMKAWLNAIPRKPDGLWDYVAPWKLGDWLDPAAPPEDPGNATTDPELVSDAFLAHIVGLMVSISELLKEDKDHEGYVELEDQLRSAFANEYITSSGRLACDTQTAFALAICFDLFSSDTQRQRASGRLEILIRQNSRFKIATGFAGTPYIGHALSRVGHTNLFYRMLLHWKNPSWLYPVIMGATTIWERWDSLLSDGTVNPGEMTSFNHYALGSVANWIHCVIVGMKPLEPGWRRFTVCPIPGGGLEWAEGRYVSVYGECRVRWETREAAEEGKQTFWISVIVPVNTHAELTMPGQQSVEKLGSGRYERSASFVPDSWPPKAIFPPTLDPSDEILQT